jgi:hypothetical protein
VGRTTLAVLVTIAFSAIGVLADYFLKLASAREHSFRTGHFALYASPAFGWVFALASLVLRMRFA